VRSGAKLDAKAKTRLSEINQQLAKLFTKFGQNVLFEEDNQFVALASEADLAGLPQSVRDAAATAATTKKQTGWVITNTRSSGRAVFDLLRQAQTCAKKSGACSSCGAITRTSTDNNSTITEILQLRVERAQAARLSDPCALAFGKRNGLRRLNAPWI
jgi:peptidyl-dipeptidase Dcp